jgi:hypothetical protein
MEVGLYSLYRPQEIQVCVQTSARIRSFPSCLMSFYRSTYGMDQIWKIVEMNGRERGVLVVGVHHWYGVLSVIQKNYGGSTVLRSLILVN